MSQTLVKIANLLSDQQYQDGTSIGDKLHITRAAVWKAIKKLESYDIPIHSVKGKGYILEAPLKLLDRAKLKSFLHAKSINFKIFEKIDSTNDYLMNKSIADKKPLFCIAETQTQGKGRLNRSWYSPFGQNIYMSLLYSFQKDVSELSGLSLVVALAVSKAIEESCKLVEPLFVKWPNDIVANQQKLAGSLIELKAESHGYCNAVIGVGINVNMQNATSKEVNQPWTAIRNLTGRYEDRNRLCAALMDQMLLYLQRFAISGLNDFIPEWRSKDCLFNQPVRLVSNKAVVSGIGAGINEYGNLILELADKTQQVYSSGDTTLLK